METETNSQERCQSCGAPFGEPTRTMGEAALFECGFCSAFTVRSGNQRRLAGRPMVAAKKKVAAKNVAAKNEVDWLHSIACRLCGGPLDAKVVADAPGSPCGYCGQRASVRPGVLSALKLLFTDPRSLPAPLRNAVLFAIATVIGAIVIAALGILRHDGLTTSHPMEVSPENFSVGTIAYEATVDVPSYAQSIGVSFLAPDLEEGDLRLRTEYRHRSSKTCLRRKAAKVVPREGHGLRVYDGIRVSPPPGPTQVSVVATAIDTLPSGPITVEVRVSQAFPLGYLILMLNVVLWLSFVQRMRVDFTSTRRRGVRIVQVITLLCAVGWAAMAIGGFDPLATKEYRANLTDTRC